MKRRRRRKSNMKLMKALLLFLLVVAGLLLAFRIVSLRTMPLVNAIATIEARNRINKIILDTINQTVVEREIVSSDFYSKTEDADGMITSLAINTVLINALCAELADNISNEFMTPESHPIAIPMGTLTGIELLANLGPNYNVRVLPHGTADVYYQSRFESAGINQINFQVWMDISVNMRIINPLLPGEIIVERRVPIVNTVFSGKVPENFFGGFPFEIQ
jgi:sporulation protein YunB